MSEESRLRFQQYYQALCRERGWMSKDGEEVWPSSPEDRATAARELFGLALIFGYDLAFVAFHHSIRFILIFTTLPILIQLPGNK